MPFPGFGLTAELEVLQLLGSGGVLRRRATRYQPGPPAPIQNIFASSTSSRAQAVARAWSTASSPDGRGAARFCLNR
jgi:hypothetical protein